MFLILLKSIRCCYLSVCFHSELNISAGIVRVEQKNNTLLEMGVYDDGPYEVGDENLLRPEFVPVPANSYLGERLKKQMWLYGGH